MWELLQEIKTALEAIPELDTVNIGAETGISAKDCPAARIVTEYREPVSATMKYYDQGAIQVILLLDLKNNLPQVYNQSMMLEEKIRQALTQIVLFNRTDYDQDAVSVFKASIIRFTFTNVRNDKLECN